MPTQCLLCSVCTGRVYDSDVFQTLTQCFYHAGVRKTDHHFTFKSGTVGSQTMQPFICCIIEQITLETSNMEIDGRLFSAQFEGWCSLLRNTTPCLLTLRRLAVCCIKLILLNGQ